jgi:hypothetical protein
VEQIRSISPLFQKHMQQIWSDEWHKQREMMAGLPKAKQQRIRAEHRQIREHYRNLRPV